MPSYIILIVLYLACYFLRRLPNPLAAERKAGGTADVTLTKKLHVYEAALRTLYLFYGELNSN